MMNMRLMNILLGLTMWATSIMVIYSDFVFAPAVWDSADKLISWEYIFVKAMTIFICFISLIVAIGGAFIGCKCFSISR